MFAWMAQVWARPGGQSWREVKQIIDFVKDNEVYPQLYIYSAADVVVLSSSIEAHMQARAPSRRMTFMLGCMLILQADVHHNTNTKLIGKVVPVCGLEEELLFSRLYS